MKLNIKRIVLTLIFFVGIIVFLVIGCNKKNIKEPDKVLMPDFTNKMVADVEKFCKDNNINLEKEEEFNSLKSGLVISQNISSNTDIKDITSLKIKVSKGLDYASLKVNELGNIPVMMYHGIHDITDNKYTGGNVDKDGYQRTKQAFENDLEFYYQNGYRMIRLNDYINGIIDVEAGYSPIVITFDDGLSNNIKVLGLDEKGEIIIDPSSAVGVLESFKKKYPDFNVTATFFVNGGLFNQSEYNEKILNWLVNNGYDIGNHSYSHADFTKITKEKSVQEIGSLYNLLDKYIPGKYVNIVALPFGSPYKKSHDNFASILKGKYNDKYYETVSTLQVGWEANYSPFNPSFDKMFLKRIRAYDNNGVDFDIEMNFKILKNTRYISDGNKDTIVIPKEKENKVNNINNLDVITY